MATAAELQQAREAFEGAYFGYASPETILAAQHALMRLEDEVDAVRVKRLRTAAGDLEYRAQKLREEGDTGSISLAIDLEAEAAGKRALAAEIEAQAQRKAAA